MDYEQLVQEALRRVVFQTLKKVEQTGLEDAQHFYISFQTLYPGVEVPEILKQAGTEETTIVLQHQFWDLQVYETFFTVMLTFHGVSRQVRVPFYAVTSFVDPSEKFGLQFTPPPFEPAPLSAVVHEDSAKSDCSIQEKESSNVIAVDFFRKK